MESMKVYIIGSGPGDPELLTVKAMRLIGGARCIIHAGSLVSDQVAELFPADAEKHDSAAMSLEEIIEVIKSAREKGIDVLRIHSGDPSIYGAINEQMDALDELGIEYEIVPGVSSFQAAAAALRTELTAPEISQSIVLTRTEGRTPLPDGQKLENFAATNATLCIFLSVHKIEEIAESLAKHYGADCPAAVVFHASRPNQLVIRGTLLDLGAKTKEAGISKTALIIVGRALGRRGAASKLYDGGFAHGYRDVKK